MRTTPGGSRLPWAAGGLLVVLLVALAALQLRWLGEVGDAERQRLEAGVRTALDGFAAEVDREVSRAWLAFFRPLRRPTADAEIAELRAAWQENAPEPELIADLRVVAAEGEPDRFGRLQASTLLPELPGIQVPLGPGGDAGESERALVVAFDRAFLAEELLPRLTGEYLVPVLGEGLEARVTVAATGEEVWATRPGLDGAFEWRQPLFDLLPPDALRRLAFGRIAGAEIDRGGDGEEGGRRERRFGLRRRFGRTPPGWILEVRPAEGSLDAALARARRGNAALSLGILLLLALAAAGLALSTRRAQAQARRQLEFTAAVSHELRTPLAAIRSLADNLADGIVPEPERARRYGQELARQGERLSGLVEQVLALGSLEARQRDLESAPVDLGPLVAEAASGAAAAFEGARVETDLEPGLPPVAADPPALRRAVENLVANALVHGGAERRARVRLHAPPPGREVLIEVSDRGPGIPPEDRERLFEPFFRGRRARESQRPGTGLGLHLVRRIAEVHGGSVEVASGPGGSTFTIRLPAARSQP